MYEAAEEGLAVYRRLGLRSLKMAEEAIVDLGAFSLAGGKRAALRSMVHKVTRMGLAVRRYDRAAAPEPAVDEQLAEISEEWLSEKRLGEMGFSLGRFSLESLDEAFVFLCLDGTRVVAFTTWRPYRGGRAALLDLMRKRKDAPSGTMDLLVARSLEELRAAGLEEASLANAPLANVGEPRGGLEKGVALLFENLNAFYGYKNLFQFKKKFAPRWEGRYLVYPRGADLPRVAYALVGVHGAGGLPATGARLDEEVSPVLYALVSAAAGLHRRARSSSGGLMRLLGLDLRELEWISDVVLAVAFGAATFLWLHLRRARTALTRLERAQVVLDTELAIAADIQQGLLPPPPPARDGWRFAARLEQAGHIGGDFYDFVDRGRSLLVLLADVSGKGIPAALVMASARALFRQLARETDRPDELLTRLGRALWEEHGGTPYLTGFLGHLDLDARSLSWVNAGHPPALLVTGTGHRALASTGPPAGLLPDTRYEAQVALHGRRGHARAS